MAEVLRLPEFWSAVSAFVWPLALLVLVLYLRGPLVSLLSRDQVNIKVAGVEIAVADAARKANEDVVKLTDRVAEIEARLERATIVPAEAAPRTTIARRPTADFALLWVDDHPENNAFLVSRLEEDGVRVRQERSTADAMRALGQERVDLVLTDLGRSEAGHGNAMAGLDLIRAMREGGHMQPILVFASARGLEKRETLIAAGAEVVTNAGVDVFKFVRRHKDAD